MFLLVVFLQLVTASAATFEQIQQACREQFKPQVKNCVRGSGSADKEAARAACKQQVTGSVKSCVQRETQRAAGNKAAPPPPKAGENALADSAIVIPSAFAPPPRTISDITAILDNEKPDASKIAQLNAAADVEPAKDLASAKLAQFYYDRGNARALLARNKDALADGLKALEVAGRGSDNKQISRIRQFIAIQQLALGQTKRALETLQTNIKQGTRGTAINASRSVVGIMVAMGDAGQADVHAKRVAALLNEARGSPHPAWRASYPIYGTSWEADADEARALVFEIRGQLQEALAAYQRAEKFRRATVKDLPRMDFPPPTEQILHAADRLLLSIARVKARQGQLAPAEADARRALLGVLKNNGKYNPQTTKFIVGLADILVEQGRYLEAERLVRSALEIRQTLGIPGASSESANILSQLGNVLLLQAKNDEAKEVFGRVELAVAKWEPAAREVFRLKASRITALYAAGQVEAGIAAAEDLVKRERARVGERHLDLAAARGVLALGYALAKRDDDAIREFMVAIPALLAARNESSSDDDPTVLAARGQRVQRIVETYIEVLARGTSSQERVAAETFPLADAIRSRSVQQALAASSARTVAKEPALAELVRLEQDLGKQTNAQLGSLNNALSLPQQERDESVIRAINATLDKLRADRTRARQDINRRFPAYAELIEPRPPEIDKVRRALQPGEAVLSFYFGKQRSFVWAVPQSGRVMFASLAVTATELEDKVNRLRAALEPQAATIEEIPALDVKLAHELYQSLIAPVAGALRETQSLIVATNGALGLLPLSVLVTEAPEVQTAEHLRFDSYRRVSWLARKFAVSQVPSVAALMTLRQLPKGPENRQPIIGFGDPYFSAAQAAAADAGETEFVVASATRGIPFQRRAAVKTSQVDSAELALLPRLPDTATELRSVASALNSDPAKALFLGKQANEKQVKSVDLAGFKVVAFATHGLVPGELNGLTQPALALTAPEVTESDGDGLLTLEEILALKLDADWVILSACNTGSGASAGAEAASGLGRAFFYAGTRALLVTNWSVHSASARELVTDVFRRQSEETRITRSEALRQSMLAMIDSGGWKDEANRELFAYAHPLFWAPYTIIGDGGRN